MNSLHAVSASKKKEKKKRNENTQRTVQPVSVQSFPHNGHLRCLMIGLYAAFCSVWTHSMHADCSFNYFLLYSTVNLRKLCLLTDIEWCTALLRVSRRRVFLMVDILWHWNKIWHDMTWHDMTWHDMTWHDMTWHDMAWHDIWYDMLWFSIHEWSDCIG